MGKQSLIIVMDEGDIRNLLYALDSYALVVEGEDGLRVRDGDAIAELEEWDMISAQ